jgi:hypothetical protein
MIRLCESCYQVIVDGAPHAVLRSLRKANADGHHERAEIHLHDYAPATRGCTLRPTSPPTTTSGPTTSPEVRP